MTHWSLSIWKLFAKHMHEQRLSSSNKGESEWGEAQDEVKQYTSTFLGTNNQDYQTTFSKTVLYFWMDL